MDRRSIGEQLRKVSLVATLALGAGACASSVDHSQPPATERPNPVVAETVQGDGSFIVNSQYFADGHRIVVISRPDRGGFISKSYDHCDGPDLVEDTAEANPPTRSVDHPACADGLLQVADFVQPQSIK